MRRGELDPTSLLAGVLFLAIGVAAVAAIATDRQLDGRWVLPILLIGLGVAGLASSLTRRR